MGDPKGFLQLRRATPDREAPAERIRHWREFYMPMPESSLRAQASRCMDCGVAFCQGDTGCPLGNVIPEWNELVRSGKWQDALEVLHSTNNFPEFTGRLCPAPCESACVLSLIDQPVTIRNIEQTIVDRAIANGGLAPRPPKRETGRRVAVIGSGPAGLAAAQQLRRGGHAVTVFERSSRVGGLLRFGIPEFKLAKAVLDRRLAQLEAEGVEFRAGVDVGTDVTVTELREQYDAICLTMGAGVARDLSVPGRELQGIHRAMDFLSQQNQRDAGEIIDARAEISAKGKHVIIIGGGDTGSDCAGTCLRQGAKSVKQFELMPQPPESRAPSTPWPLWPMQLRTSHAHEEGTERDWSIATTAFSGRHGCVEKLHATRIGTELTADGVIRVNPIRASEMTFDADLVLLAMGFTGVEESAWISELGVECARGVIKASGHQTSADGVFTAGDARRGQSLIVWAIREGRDAAQEIDCYLRTLTDS